MFDIVFRDATLIDGTGAPARRGDLAVAGGRIAAVGGEIRAASREVVDASHWARPPWT